MRGLQIRYRWREIETSKDVYDFSQIDNRLSELEAIGKRLIIIFDMKTYNPADDTVPDYAKAAEYDGGQFTYTAAGSTVPKGNSTALFNKNVIGRLQKLFREFAQRYDNEPYFEAFGISESSAGEDQLAELGKTSIFYKSLRDLDFYGSTVFKHTLFYQNLNYPRPELNNFNAMMRASGVALGTPDVFLEDVGLNIQGAQNTPDGVYAHYSYLNGIVPLMPAVQELNYTNTKHDLTGYDPTLQELLDFAKNNLFANYLLWTRLPENKDEVLAFLNLPAQTADPYGGLNSNLPLTYHSVTI